MKVIIIIGLTVAAMVFGESWVISLILIGVCGNIAIADLKKSGWKL